MELLKEGGCGIAGGRCACHIGSPGTLPSWKPTIGIAVRIGPSAQVVLVSNVKGWKLFIVEQTRGPPFSAARSELHLPGARLCKAMFNNFF
jgi:hypothetical protein